MSADIFNPKEPRFDRDEEKNATLQSQVFGVFSRIPVLSRVLQAVGASGRTDSVGLGMRYTVGMDYYNTQFVRDISFWQLVVFVDGWSARIQDP